MKKTMISILLTLATAASMTACSEGILHIHDYSSDWVYDDDSHWQVCECGEKNDAEEHDYDDRECTVCKAAEPSEGLEFAEVADGYAVKGIGECTDREIVIPSEYKGDPVVEIGSRAFFKCDTIESVVIPDSVTRISDRAFWLCTSVERIKLPDSVTYISEYAFWECNSLTDISIPDDVYAIGEFAFDGCTSLEQIEIPDGITEIERGLFYNCPALEEITLPDSVKVIGEKAFYNCTGLKTITMPATLEVIHDASLMNCTALTSIQYLGTKSQWQAIEIKLDNDWKTDTFWDTNSGDYTVHCSDGDLSKWEA